MILHRTSNPKRRASLSFLRTSEQQRALLAQLETKEWIDEIFSRRLPIPVVFQTRFGPTGFSKNVFYASLEKETSFFEFGYRLLRRLSLVGLSVRAVCFEVDFLRKGDLLDIRDSSDAKAILNRDSYAGAHAWLQELSTIPDSVLYPSVRDPKGEGLNLAIFERASLVGTMTDPAELIFTPQTDGAVNIESVSAGALRVIIPVV